MIDRAKKILEIEAEAILDLRNKLNKDFDKSVDMILKCEGKVIVKIKYCLSFYFKYSLRSIYNYSSNLL